MIVNLCLPNYKIIKNKIIIVKPRVGRRVGGRPFVLLPRRSTFRDLSLR